MINSDVLTAAINAIKEKSFSLNFEHNGKTYVVQVDAEDFETFRLYSVEKCGPNATNDIFEFIDDFSI